MPLPFRLKLAVAALFLAAFATIVLAAPEESGKLYRRAMVKVTVTPEQLNAVFEKPYQLPPTPLLREAVEANAEPLRQFAQAAAADSVDLRIDYAKGYDDLIEVLPFARQIALLDVGAAAVAADAGRDSDAADRLAAVFRFARHIGNEPTLVTKLVQGGIENLRVDAAEAFLPRLSPAAVSRLRDSLLRLPPDQPFADAVRRDGRIGADYFASLEKFPQKKFMDFETGEWLDLTPEQRAAWADPATRRKWADGVARQAEDAADALALPPAERHAKLDAVHAARADYGPLAAMASMNLNPMLDARQSIVARLALLRAALDVRVVGRDALPQTPDPTDGKPFDYAPLDGGGFVLTSRYALKEKPLTFRVEGVASDKPRHDVP